MAERAADDFTFIGKKLRKNRVLEMCHRANLTSGTIPDEILLAAGFSSDDIKNIPSTQRTMPLNESDLM